MSDETRKQGSVLPLGESLAGFLCSDGVFRVKSGEFRRATVGEWWQDKANGRVYCVNSEYPQDILVEPDLPAPSQTEGGGPDDTKQVSKEQGASPSVTPGVTKNVGDDRTGETDENFRAGAESVLQHMELVKNDPQFKRLIDHELNADLPARWIIIELIGWLRKGGSKHPEPSFGKGDGATVPMPEVAPDSGRGLLWLDDFTNETQAEPLGEAPKPEPAAAVPGEGEITVNRAALTNIVGVLESEKERKGEVIPKTLRILRAALDGDKEGPA